MNTFDYSDEVEFNQKVFEFPSDSFENQRDRNELSLIYDDVSDSMKTRDQTTYLRPICIDAVDVSNRYYRSMQKILKNCAKTSSNVLKTSIDQSKIRSMKKNVFYIRPITRILWHFISRGHTTVAFLPSTLRDFAAKCSDPHELYLLSKMEVIMFDDSTWAPRKIDRTSTIFGGGVDDDDGDDDHDENDDGGGGLGVSRGGVVNQSEELAKNIAICAANSDGCIVGSLKKYYQLIKKYPETGDIIANGFIRCSFEARPSVSSSSCSSSSSLSASSSSSMTHLDIMTNADLSIPMLKASEKENQMAFQMLAADQILLMRKLAKILGDEKLCDLCRRSRKMKEFVKNEKRFKFFSASQNSSETPYHYLDPFLPEYVAPPSSPPEHIVTMRTNTTAATTAMTSNAPTTSVKSSRIGHENSIYRVDDDNSGGGGGGGGCIDDDEPERCRRLSMRNAIFQTLESIFGGEKANFLVDQNPECDDINILIELGLMSN